VLALFGLIAVALTVL
jgi:hypothetical protein